MLLPPWISTERRSNQWDLRIAMIGRADNSDSDGAPMAQCIDHGWLLYTSVSANKVEAVISDAVSIKPCRTIAEYAQTEH